MLLALAALAIVVGLLTDAAVRPASGATLTTTSPTTAGHSYRHGAVPLRHWSNATPQTSSPTQTSGPGAGAAKFARGGNPLLYAGGPVINGSPKVFLVFWGTQWGSQSLLGGYQAFSGDPQHLAPNLQAFLSGLGTNGELWSAIVTQYCQGALIGARSCPLLPSADHVAYPSSSVLGGVWEDTRAASPAAATATQIAQEGADAAAHFSHPANSQYIVVSPTGTDPDGWLDPVNGYCAYHDDTQDPAIGGVTGPDVPYTNMPYVPDVGAACSSFSSPGPNDGADETLSHEYAETLTDPYPSSGWNDRSGSEIGDKCENLVGGTPGGSIYLTLSTGTFVVQGLWANDLGTHGGCENVHSSVLVANPGKQRGSLSVPASLQISALDVRGLSLTYGALGLPTGLVVSPTTGLISGTPLHRGRFHATVDVIDSSGTTGVSFVWVIGR
ncbi:MAG TPA: Ig domain-containing protein [Acidimicrobiales bacterium]|nr:Ig domain-containing protein [Acidimicrobiales bacterium]